MEEVKRQQQQQRTTKDGENELTESSIVITSVSTVDTVPLTPEPTVIEIEDDDIMIID